MFVGMALNGLSLQMGLLLNQVYLAPSQRLVVHASQAERYLCRGPR
jgi:hypothetical protein